MILSVHITQSFQKLNMGCRGICGKYKAKKPFMTSRYASGQKRCSPCDIFINWDGNHCPCCNILLRTKPKGTEDRHRLLLVRQNKK